MRRQRTDRTDETNRADVMKATREWIRGTQGDAFLPVAVGDSE